MKIDHENIEAYLLDYLTDQLSWEESVAVQKYLEEHPDFDPGQKALVFLPDEEVVFQKKELLKKNLRFDIAPEYLSDEERKERLFFLLSEDQLLPDDETNLKELCLQDEKFKKEAEIALYTRFYSEKNIKFSKKQNLKKKSRKRRIIPWASFAAASLLFTFLSYIFQERSTSKTFQNVNWKRNEVKLSGKKKNKHNTSLPDQPRLERSSQQPEINSFYLVKTSGKSEQECTFVKSLAFNSELNSFSKGSAQRAQDSSLSLSRSFTAVDDTLKTIDDQLAIHEANFSEMDHFNYLMKPQKQNLGTIRNMLVSKEKATKSFHIRIGKFYFFYSKSLSKK
jgi:hypothetical protein